MRRCLAGDQKAAADVRLFGASLMSQGERVGVVGVVSASASSLPLPDLKLKDLKNKLMDH